MMESKLARRIHELLCETLELEPQDRRRTIDMACAESPELARRRNQLLAAIGESGAIDFLEQPVLGGIADTPSVGERDMPDRIGNYRIVGAIGSGGMATVYEAIQDQPNRRVAIKIPKQDRRRSALHQEVKLESEVLARLRHPAIAQIYEAGIHKLPDGAALSYFAMEFVPNAKRLTHYGSENRLSIDQRLELFVTVCSAVHHGHRNGVIHRDLKPANILVDSDGNPKVIDFGLARAKCPGDESSPATDAGGRVVGTLNYLSPELCTPGANWDARSDVYSLGVILFELLCGKLPHSLSDVPIPEAFRRLREDQPARPRSMDPSIPIDLEAIILKAIDRDPEKRYSGADALASDVLRFRNHLPVEARPLTAWYQLRKFARRNPALTASLFAVLFLLATGILVSSRLAWLANASRLAAEKRGQELSVVVQFQESLLRDLDIAAMGDRLDTALREAVTGSLIGDEQTTRENLEKLTAEVNFSALAIRFLRENILQRYADSIQQEFAEEPVLKALMLQRLAGTFHVLGLHADAEPALREALEIRRKHLGDRHPDTLLTLHSLGSLLDTLGHHEVARPLLEEAHQGRAALLGAEHEDTLRSGTSLGGVYRSLGRLKDAEQVWSQTLASQRRVLGDDHPDTLRTLNNVGVVCAYQGRLGEAEIHWRELVERRRNSQGSDHPELRGSLGNLGILLLDQGKTAEARPLIEEALAADRRHLGDSHSNTFVTMTQLAELLHKTGELEQAERLMKECVEGRRKAFGSENPATLRSEAALAMIMLDRGNSAGAEKLLQDTLAQQRVTHGERHSDTIRSIVFMSNLKSKSGKLDEALVLSSEAVQFARELQLNGDLPLGEILSQHGELLLDKLMASKAEQDETLDRDIPVSDRPAPTAAATDSPQSTGLKKASLSTDDPQNESLSLLNEGYERLSSSLRADHPKVRAAALRLARYFDWAHKLDPSVGHDATAANWLRKGKAK